jgi:hypothetical protein
LTTAEIAEAAQLSGEARSLLSDGIGPSRFVQLLEERALFKEAIQFLAHGLPLPVTVRWGCACSRELLPSAQLEQAKESLQCAEAWLAEPTDDARWQARRAAEKSDMSNAADFVAMAVFLSGSVTPPDAPPTPPPPYVASKLAAGGIQLAVLSREPANAPQRYRRALQISREIVRTSGQHAVP